MPISVESIKYYFNLINPAIPKKQRILSTYGRLANKNFDFLNDSQWWSRTHLENYRNEKLRKLINHCYENVPYYNDLFKLNRINPTDINTIDDLYKIPILTKELIRENREKLISNSKLNFHNGSSGRTGASTGSPLIFYRDSFSDQIAWLSFLRFYRWMGYEWGEKSVWLWGAPVIRVAKKQRLYIKIANWLQSSYVKQIYRFDAFKMDDIKLHKYIRNIRRINPKILRGYVSALVKLARFCREYGYNDILPKAVTTTAEMLHNRDRMILENQFNCKVFDHYACGECLGMAFECEKHEGLHVTDEHCVIEFVDKNNERVRPGDKGKLILTDLDNYVMPFIRYENGDVGSYKKERCGCGRGLSMINPIEGRVSDLIIGAGGMVVHGEYFTHLLGESGWYEKYGLTNFEVVQRKNYVIDWFFVCSQKPSSESIKELIDNCQDYLGDIKLRIQFVEEIPSSSYKRRFTRSEIDYFSE